jgi:hypothetical protein
MAMKKAMLSFSNSFRGTSPHVTTKEQLEDEHTAKIVELRKVLGPLEGHIAIFCSDDCLVRYLKARNWNVKAAEKMLKNTIKWREAYKPEEIRWVSRWIWRWGICSFLGICRVESQKEKVMSACGTAYSSRTTQTVLLGRDSLLLWSSFSKRARAVFQL